MYSMANQIDDFSKWLDSALSVESDDDGGRARVLLNVVEFPIALTREQALCMAERLRQLALPIPTCEEFLGQRRANRRNRRLGS